MKIRELDNKYQNQINVFRKFFNENFNTINEDDLLVNKIEDDDSLWIEWIFKNFRYGFIIEVNVEESSFYFVSNREMGELNVSALINDPISSELIKIINKKVF